MNVEGRIRIYATFPAGEGDVTDRRIFWDVFKRAWLQVLGRLLWRR